MEIHPKRIFSHAIASVASPPQKRTSTPHRRTTRRTNAMSTPARKVGEGNERRSARENDEKGALPTQPST
eukprot:scaffold840_cov344-Pavlova_lutheri.AAC.38